MMRTSISLALGFSVATLLVTGCGKKPEPKSVTTTSTQTTRQDDTGESSTTNSKVKTTEMPDGSKSVQTTQKTDTNAPATAPSH
ncbi:MAG: hypothetical protein ABJE66_00960 [Deltaproteobacteria bacterium]